jgi:hypothetical protein
LCSFFCPPLFSNLFDCNLASVSVT